MDSQRLRLMCVQLTTFSVLAAGVLSLQATYRGDAIAAVQLILLAVVLDGVDGAIARRWGLASAQGGQLDSLADLAAFGIAPGFLVTVVHFQFAPDVAAGLAVAFCGAGAYRLARFNVEGPRPAFAGVPITVAAAVLASVALPSFRVPPQWIAGVMVVLSALMVSRVEYYAAKSERQRYLVVPAVMIVLLLLSVDLAAVVIGAFFVCYTAGGLLLAAQRWIEERDVFSGQPRPR